MAITITTIDNKSAEAGLADILRRILLDPDVATTIQQSMLSTIKGHFSQRFPGSSHYDPSKVVPSETSKNVAAIDINIPGVSRAYHDIDIYPRTASALAIPMNHLAIGRSPREFSNLTFIKKKNGNAFLAQNNGGNLTFMYYLSKHVHQRQDSSIMPTNKTLIDNLIRDVGKFYSEQSKK